MTIACNGTVDLETAEWDRFVLGAIYDGCRAYVFYQLDGLIDELRKRGGTWWSHAGGVFDFLAILERARARGISCQVDRAGSRITRIVMGRLTLRDSYSLWPSPLDDLAGALGVPVPALPWTCECDQECGGYCAIARKANEGDPDLEDYCIADCRVLYNGIQLIKDFAADHKIDLRGTLGQTAWLTAQAELGIPDSTISWPEWSHAKRGDKGGRHAIVRPRVGGDSQIAAYDICSAYPAQLAHAELPVGDSRKLGASHALLALGRERPGIYTLTVRVPEDTFLPPLPWSYDGQLTFPTGVFSGSWTLPEIGHALDRGVEILEGHAALVYEATAPVFAPLVERWYAIRKKVGRKTPLGQWIGRLAKALTGKFAEKPDRMRVTMHPAEIKFCTRSGPCDEGCTGACGAYEQLDLFGEIWGIPYERLGPSAYPQWSAYLRAACRIQWHEQAERFDRDLVMGNTDSLFVTGRKIPKPTGSQLGQWERQGVYRDMEIRSVGTYAMRELGGKMIIRGVPGLTEADWKRGTGVIDRGVATLGRSMGSTKGLFQRKHRRWSLPAHERTIYGDRKIAMGGITVPLDAQEIREAVAKRRALR